MNNRKNFTHRDFASVLSRYKYRLNIGDITAGTIFSEEKKGFLVDIGESIAGYLPKDEISINKYNITIPKINNSREFFILAYNKKSQQLILSIKRLEYIRGWERIKQIKQEDITIDFHVNRINKGGILTTLEGIQGFIPNSHINKIAMKTSLINKKIKCKLLFIHEKTNTIIISHKRTILTNMLPNIYLGKITIGKINSIKNYGIFIDVDGFLGLLHISEIENENINNKNLFFIGNVISIQIIHIDTKQARLSVSRKYII